MKFLAWLVKRKLMVVCLLAVMMSSYAQNSSYIKKHKSLTEQLAEKFGIPYKVILGIAIVESSSGQSKASKSLKNHFGITGRTQLNKKIKYHTRYKAYGTEEESFNDFCKIVTRKAFYPELKDCPDENKWVRALALSGYSELPKVWEKRVLDVISSNKL